MNSISDTTDVKEEWMSIRGQASIPTSSDAGVTVKRELSVDSSGEEDEGHIAKSRRTYNAESAGTTSLLDSKKEESDEVKKEEGSEASLTRQVIYSRFGPWYGHDWHIIGDGINFVVGFTTEWNAPNVHSSWPVVLDSGMTRREEIMKRLPESTFDFWNQSRCKTNQRSEMKRKIIDWILSIRQGCQYDVPRELLREDAIPPWAKFVHLPTHAQVSFDSCDLSKPPQTWFAQ